MLTTQRAAWSSESREWETSRRTVPTFGYNDRDEPIEEIDEHQSRGAGLDDQA